MIAGRVRRWLWGESSSSRPDHVVLITNVAAPYRLPALRHLAAQVQLTLICCGERGSEELPWDIDFADEPFSSLRLNSRVWRVGNRQLHFSPRLLSALWRSRPTAVISGGFSLSTAYAALYCTVLRRPLLIFSDGTRDSECRNPSTRNSPLQNLARRVVVRCSAGAIAASAPAAARFEELGFERSRVHLALHSTEMEPYWSVGATRSSRERPVRFLYVGRLIEGKGLDQLLEAFAEVAARCPQASLWIVGSGPLEERLRAAAARAGAGKVKFFGFVEQGLLPGIYAQAQVFVFPTVGDTFGMAMLEAAAAGLAIVSTPWAGANDHLVREGASGTVVDPGNRPSLVATLVQLADEPDRVAAWGRESHRLSRAHSPEATAAGYLQAVRRAESG